MAAGNSQSHRLFSCEELAKGARYHCVTILDVFRSEDDRLDFLTMSLLVKFWMPRFSTVDEVLDFMRQTLDVLPSFLRAVCKVTH